MVPGSKGRRAPDRQIEPEDPLPADRLPVQGKAPPIAHQHPHHARSPAAADPPALERGRPPLRQPNRRTGVLVPADGGDEPVAPRRLPLDSREPAGAGLRHQGDAGPGRGDNACPHNMTVLLDSRGASTDSACLATLLLLVDGKRRIEQQLAAQQARPIDTYQPKSLIDMMEKNLIYHNHSSKIEQILVEAGIKTIIPMPNTGTLFVNIYCSSIWEEVGAARHTDVYRSWLAMVALRHMRASGIYIMWLIRSRLVANTEHSGTGRRQLSRPQLTLAASANPPVPRL